MPNFQGDYQKSDAGSRLDSATTTAPMLLDLAPELISRIASLLDVKDLLAFRRVCLCSVIPYRCKLTHLNSATASYLGSVKTDSSGDTYFVIYTCHYPVL